jgi:uncharacterized oxidoreductase
MPLQDFISDVMQILNTQPDVTEVLVDRVLPLRNCAVGGQEKYQAIFKQLNDYMSAARG